MLTHASMMIGEYISAREDSPITQCFQAATVSVDGMTRLLYMCSCAAVSNSVSYCVVLGANGACLADHQFESHTANAATHICNPIILKCYEPFRCSIKVSIILDSNTRLFRNLCAPGAYSARIDHILGQRAVGKIKQHHQSDVESRDRTLSPLMIHQCVIQR